ncbi:peptide deformylase 2-like [Ylistrum balloti]|uniref:peptide deformylase 2-like n=1 Tax=Ylistrum balloti TaxID=509963 RepID=UPI0029058CEC|nr:peptide deformylase 2-like [Ylistrum balloti]
MSRLLQIAQLGHPILRQAAQEIETIQVPDLQLLISDMLATVIDANGVGIAAPQVYQSKRLFIISSKPNPRYPYAPTMDPMVMINPSITWKSTEMETDWEGCLSIPGLRGLVPRHQSIEVLYFTTGNEQVTATYEGFIARVFQHEFDHLEAATDKRSANTLVFTQNGPRPLTNSIAIRIKNAGNAVIVMR